jgi:hypothetical protein
MIGPLCRIDRDLKIVDCNLGQHGLDGARAGQPWLYPAEWEGVIFENSPLWQANSITGGIGISRPGVRASNPWSAFTRGSSGS